MNTKNGTDQLTKTLNGYMEALVHEVIKYDGDIMKFAGLFDGSRYFIILP